MLMNTTFLEDSFLIKWQSRVISQFFRFVPSAATGIIDKKREFLISARRLLRESGLKEETKERIRRQMICR